MLLAVAVLALRASLDEPDTGARAAALPQPPDSKAPLGAPPHWIPSDEWVMQHWLPFDEARLLRLLQVERSTLWRHLRDDRRTLAQLAERHGWPDPRALASALVAPRRAAVASGKARELEARAVQTLTRGHLAQHLLFHSLHQDAVPDRARTIFGTPNPDRFQRLRRLDISPLQIARMNGRSGAQVRLRSEVSLRERAAAGVRAGDLSERQAELLVARQLRQLPRWLSESHYNGPPRTNRKGRLSERPKPAWAAPAITADGTRVVMEAYEPTLPVALERGEIGPGDRCATRRGAGRRRGTTRLVSRAGGRPMAGFASEPAISADGSAVAFSLASTSVLHSTSRDRPAQRVYLRDLGGGRTQAVSARRGYAGQPSVSADGARVAFTADEGGPVLRVRLADASGGGSASLAVVSSYPAAAIGSGGRRHLCRLQPPAW